MLGYWKAKARSSLAQLCVTELAFCCVAHNNEERTFTSTLLLEQADKIIWEAGCLNGVGPMPRPVQYVDRTTWRHFR